jgi:transposase-like protein
MKRARFTEDQIIGVLKEHEAGAKTADLARKHGVSEATLYNWKGVQGARSPVDRGLPDLRADRAQDHLIRPLTATRSRLP